MRKEKTCLLSQESGAVMGSWRDSVWGWYPSEGRRMPRVGQACLGFGLLSTEETKWAWYLPIIRHFELSLRERDRGWRDDSVGKNTGQLW